MEVKSWGGKCKGVFIVAFFFGKFFEATIHKRVVVVVWRVWMMCFFPEVVHWKNATAF